jgi:hypothetical protein
MIRGDRKNPSLQGPSLTEYQKLYEYVRRLWSSREEGRYGSVVEPMLQWAKTKTAEAQAQVVPCRAGILSAVVYSNGDVSMCETHTPLGNLREKSFGEIWSSPEAETLRQSIKQKDCYCTNEVFLWPSITYQPQWLVKAMVNAKVWKNTQPLAPGEKLDITADAVPSARPVVPERLVTIQQTSGKA